MVKFSIQSPSSPWTVNVQLFSLSLQVRGRMMVVSWSLETGALISMVPLWDGRRAGTFTVGPSLVKASTSGWVVAKPSSGVAITFTW